MTQMTTITKEQAINAFKALSSGVLGFQNEINKYAATRNIKKLKKITEEIEDLNHELRLKHCLKDDKKCPDKTAKDQFRFTEEGEKALTKDIKALLAQDFEFEPYKFQNNPEMQEKKFIMMNSDLDFLLCDELLAEPKEQA